MKKSLVLLVLHLPLCGMHTSVSLEDHMLDAHAALGEIYLFGKGCKPDYEKALEHFEKVQNVDETSLKKAWAFFYTAMIYRLGLAGKPDFFESRRLLNNALKACQNDGPEADELHECATILDLFTVYDEVELFEDVDVLKKKYANHKDIFGKTVLFKALEQNFSKVIDVLILWGADVHKSNDMRRRFHESLVPQTPFELALASPVRRSEGVIERGMEDARLTSDGEIFWRALIFDKSRRILSRLNSFTAINAHPLHCACLMANIKEIQRLVQQGASVFEAGPIQLTPLRCAVFSGSEEAVTALIKKALEGEHRKSTPPEEHSEKFLLNKIIESPFCFRLLTNLHAKDYEGKRPLYYAAQAGNEKMFFALLSLGARVTGSIITAALRSGNSALCNRLLNEYWRPKKGSVLKPAKRDVTLHAAAHGGNNELIGRLVEKREALINEQDEEGNTPLFYAVYAGHADAVRLLIERGADHQCPCFLFERNRDEALSLIEVATTQNNMQMVRLLFSLGVPLPRVKKIEIVRDRLGHALSGLLSAIRNYCYESAVIYVMQSLSAREENPQARAVYDTVLAWLLISPSKRFSDLIMKKYALAESDTDMQYAWFDAALSLGNTEIVESFLRRGEINVNEQRGTYVLPLVHAALLGDYSMMELLISYGADVDQCFIQNERTQTPLGASFSFLNDYPQISAVCIDTEKIVSLLIKSGATINYRFDGTSALHEAVYVGSERLLQLLLNKGADINLKNDHEETPLHTAAKLNNSALVRLLIEQGADKMCKNKEGKLAVDLATQQEIKALLRD